MPDDTPSAEVNRVSHAPDEHQLLAHAASLAGAPKSPAAGVEVHARLGQVVERGQPLCTVYADAPGELRYALQHVADRPAIIEVSEPS